MDLKSIEVGKQFECPDCGETLRKVSDDQFREVASDREHACWRELPEGAEHLRMGE